MPGTGGPFLMAAHVRTVQVPEADRRELERRARDKGAPARVVERARIVLLAADEMAGKQIAAMVGCAEGTVVTWRGRYAERGLAGLADLPRSGKPSPLPESLRDRVLELTLAEPPTALGATHWSSRLLADALAGEGTPISHATVARIWHRFGVQPWRAGTFKFSTDPELEGKIRDVVGLYLHPPERAVVLCVDEKPQIQALERTAPTLPVRPGHPAAASFDYLRHGTTTLFAALEVATGKVTEACTDRHRHQEFGAFLTKEIVSSLIAGRCGETIEECGRTTAASSTTRRWRRFGCGRPSRSPAVCRRPRSARVWRHWACTAERSTPGWPRSAPRGGRHCGPSRCRDGDASFPMPSWVSW